MVMFFCGLQHEPETDLGFHSFHRATASMVFIAPPGCMLNLGADTPLPKLNSSEPGTPFDPLLVGVGLALGTTCDSWTSPGAEPLWFVVPVVTPPTHCCLFPWLQSTMRTHTKILPSFVNCTNLATRKRVKSAPRANMAYAKTKTKSIRTQN